MTNNVLRLLPIAICLCMLVTQPAFALTLEGGADKTGASGGTAISKTPGPGTTDGGPGGPDLHPYLTDNGRGFDRCKYQKDHPAADTLINGKPDYFAPGQPIGNTRSVNGNPAKYVRCAMDPCNPGGTQCWKNPAYRKPRSMNEIIDDNLQTRGCTQSANGKIHCPTPPIPAGADAAFYPKRSNQDNCYRTATGIGCDTGNNGGGHTKTTTATRKTAPKDPYDNGQPHQPLSAFFGRVDPKGGNASQPQNRMPASTGVYHDPVDPQRYTPPPPEASDDGLYHGNIEPRRVQAPMTEPGAPGSYLNSTHDGQQDAPPGSYLGNTQ